MTGELQNVSKNNPCIHCGKDGWCYTIGDLSCCKREAEPADGWVKTKKADSEGTPYYAPKGTAKEIRSKSKKEFIYQSRDGQPLVLITRIDDGNGGRKFPQSYFLNGRPVSGLPKPIGLKCPVYRYPEVRAAVARGEQIFFVEGEGVADALWALGIPATTTLGGSGKYRTYGSYLEDLAGAHLVLCPDRDEPGLAHTDEVAKDFPDAQWLYAPPSEFYWSNPPKSGGLDLVDWIANGATKEQIYATVGERHQDKPKESASLPAQPKETDYLATMEQIGRILEIEDTGRQRWELEILGKSLKFSRSQLVGMFQEYQQGRKTFAPKEARQFLAEGVDEFEWIVAGHITTGTTLLLYADGGVGKSLLAYDLCKVVASGSDWNGFPTKQGKVLILQTDEPEIATRERLNTANFASEVPEGQVFIQMDWQFSQVRQLRQWIERERPVFVMIDSLTSTNRSSEDQEKDSNYGAVFYDLRDLANEFSCSIMVIHHENKVGGARGSTAIRNNVSEVWHLTSPDPKEGLSKLHRILEIDKSRSSCSGKFQIELNPDDYSWQHHGDHGAPEDAVVPLSARLLSYLEQHRGVRFESEELVHEFGGSSQHTIYKALEKHRKKGLVYAEDRIKQHQSGAKKYKVYFSPPIKVGVSEKEGEQVGRAGETLASKEPELLSHLFSLPSQNTDQGEQVGRAAQSNTESGVEPVVGAALPTLPDTPPSPPDWKKLLKQDKGKNIRSAENDTDSTSD